MKMAGLIGLVTGLLALSSSWCSFPSASAAESMKRPMDPLTAAEILIAVRTLREHGHTDYDVLFPLITLNEPPKATVLKWKPGIPIRREAFLIAKKERQTFEAVVNLGNRKVVSWKQIEGVQPNILLTQEWSLAERLVKENAEWRGAVRKRGIENIDDVVCMPQTVGYFGDPTDHGRRLVRVVCFNSRGVKNYWGRPIEGVIAVVELNESKVVRVIDLDPIPIPDESVDFHEGAIATPRDPVNAISMSQPKGPSYELKGHRVSWQKWQFHFRVDPRVGPVISLVSYRDAGKLRSVLYQGTLSEMFVPYMDPSAGWYFKTFLDAGEYGIGKLAAPLVKGLDCPLNARYHSATFADDWGTPYRRGRVACLFERRTGDIAWRHYDAVHKTTEVRPRTELVVRFIATLGNYDYILDWVFREDGSIKVSVGATGIDQVKAVESPTAASPHAARDTAYGRMVAERTVAVNHDHFFSFRLDLDVDGRKNSFVADRLKVKPVHENSPVRSVWVLEGDTVATENAAKMRVSLAKPALWRVVNPGVAGPLGYPVSYQLKPGANAFQLLSPRDFPQKRAGFTEYNLWVTPYDPEQRYAAGTYPNQSRGGDGLPKWTRANRPVENTDIVLWYTLGFHHVVRAEDWPVLPTSSHEFLLRPFDFFAKNPALDIPASEDSKGP